MIKRTIDGLHGVWGDCVFDEIDSRGLEVFTALLLLIGEANIISVTLNKQQGFFTLNVGSNLFDWRTPQVVTASTPLTQTSPPQTAVIPTETYSILDNPLVTNIGEVETINSTSASDSAIMLFGILLITVFLLEDPFANTTHSANT
jgi:hypothetical protein